MNNKLISFVIPCYNDAVYVVQAVNSALSQTYSEIEVIVVDDGSNLETKKVLSTVNHSKVTIITQNNAGQSAARNKGISLAKGIYIVNLDSDDYFEPTFCESAIPYLDSDQEIALVSCYSNLLYEDGTIKEYIPKGGILEDFLFANRALGNAMFRKSDWEQIGGYDENMRQGWEDWEFYIRLMALRGKCYIIKKTLFNYRKRKCSTTARANKNKYLLYDYIFNKHQALYKKYYPQTIQYLLHKIKKEEDTKLKRELSLEYRIGSFILSPLRFLKSLFS